MHHTEPEEKLLLAAVAERRLAVFSGLADDLLQEIEGVDPATGEALRAEAVRLLGICHEIVCLLAASNVAKAHNLSVGNVDQGGDVLGVAV